MGASTIGVAGVRGMMRTALSQDTGVLWVPQVAGPVLNSTSAIETYPFIGQVPAMVEWLGSRSKKEFNEESIAVENTHFEATIPIMVSELRRDKTDSLRLRIQELAQRAAAHWASHISGLILAGETGLCYDGQAFFDDDHIWGDSGTQSNDISVDISALPAEVHGSTTAPSPEEAQLAILQGITQITSFKDDKGEPKNETANEFLVMTGVGLAPMVRSALAKGVGVSAATSDMGGFTINQATNVRLNASTTKLYIFRTDSMAKPLMRQQEGPVSIKQKGPGSDYEFDNDAHEYGVDAWRKAFYAHWDSACLVTLA